MHINRNIYMKRRNRVHENLKNNQTPPKLG